MIKIVYLLLFIVAGHGAENWKIDESSLGDRSIIYRGQTKSLIKWDRINPNSWLDLSEWKSQLELKEKNQLWIQELRKIDHKELMGKVLACYGECSLYRGQNSIQAQYLSQIQEGDELHLSVDSYAWIYLMDGTILRLSPESGLSFLEINWKKSEVFISLRLNQGHLYAHHRGNEGIEFLSGVEFDQIMYPLMIKNANHENFLRTLYQESNSQDAWKKWIKQDHSAQKLQWDSFLNLKNLNVKPEEFRHRIYLTTPKFSLEGENASFHAVTLMGGNGYFKNVSNTKSTLRHQYRGYLKDETPIIEDKNWHVVSTDGRLVNVLDKEKQDGILNLLELVVARPRTVLLAREIMFKAWSEEIYRNLYHSERMGKRYGYYIWDEDLEKRISYLREYFKRVETTQLKAIENIIELGNGVTWEREEKLKINWVSKLVESYMMFHKKSWQWQSEEVRAMSDSEFHLWVAKNVRKMGINSRQ